MKLVKLTFAALLLASAPLVVGQRTYTQIDVPGAMSAAVLGINTAGDLVGYYFDASNNVDGFLLSDGTYTTIDYPGSTLTILSGINDLGQIVGETYNPNVGFLYDVQSKTFTTLSYPHAEETIPSVINNAGTIAGSVFYGVNVFHGFELVGSTYRQISPPRTFQSYVFGITTSGILFGQAVGKIPNLTFAFAHGKYSLRVIPNAPGALVFGVNPAGTALVGYYTPSGASSGFIYQNNTLTTLQFPGSNNTFAAGINAAGEVVGYFVDASNLLQGFTWTPPAAEVKKGKE